MNNKLAIHGGTPIRNTVLQYGKQTIDQSDKDAVLSVLDENAFLTTGPKVVEFEEECKKYCGAKYAIGIHWGTFKLSLEVMDEPPSRLTKSLKRAGISDKKFKCLQHGEKWDQPLRLYS